MVTSDDEVSPSSGDPRPTDEMLMARVQNDDAIAFTELYARHVDRALGIAADICRDDRMAEDAVQESFLSIWRSRADYRPQLGSFVVWAMRIVHNRSVDSVRTRPSLTVDRRPPSGAELDDDHPLADAIAAFERAHLLLALRHLPRTQAQVIVLAFHDGLSRSEIAVRLGIPAGTVKGRVRAGLVRLRYELLFAPPIGARK